jgi:transposase InsO family protein
MVSYLCELASVSRSGYYAWLAAVEIRQGRLDQDEKDIILLKEIFYKKNQKVGALQIKMYLENDKNVVMNHKKIRRLMWIYGLVAKVRRTNPYKKMAKASQEHRIVPNLLKRVFNQEEPGKVLLTDITYLYYGNGQKAFLSCVKDGCTKEILAHYISTSLEMDIVYKTLERLKKAVLNKFHSKAILHSDQGVHYTNPLFQKKVKKLGITQSMSRRGNCWDNAPMESFFGHFKDEVEYKECKSLKELKSVVNAYMKEYNHQRYQWGLNKMTPAQYRSHLLAA